MPESRAIIELPERYRPVRHIANGGMATVWAAHDTLLDRQVAIKLLAPHLAENERARSRFQREARMAAGLSAHPNAVTIYDVGECFGRSFIVMEALPGGSLADRLRDGARVPHEEALDWLAQAAKALDAAHDRGLVHRDVKPGNMLFDDHGRLVIADFGIARLAYDPTLTTTGEVLGTAAYISPEQAKGEPATPASDLYSLAVVAYELLTGTRPFRAEHFAATARQHMEVEPEPPSQRNPSLPVAVDEVLLRALAKDPSERWTRGSEFVEALRAAASDASAESSGETQTLALAATPSAPVTGAPPARGLALGHHPPAGSPPVPPARPAPGPSPRSGAAAPPPRRPAVPRSAAPPAAAASIRSPAAPPPRRPRAELPPDEPPPTVAHRPGRRRRALIAAVVVAALAAGVLVALASSGGGELDARGTVADEPRENRAARDTGSRSERRESEPAATQPAPAETDEAPTATQEDGGASTGAGESAAALNQQGFELLNQRRYGEAVPVLQRAVKACGNDPQDLTCAYAMYNLGRSLRLAGRPGEAVPVLERRLKNPDQRSTVQTELDAARAAAGGGGGGE